MTPNLPNYPVTSVGSWPRPSWLMEARKKRKPDLPQLEDEATRLAIQSQEEAGVDIIVDGEQRRDNFLSFISGRIEGMKLMSMADLLEYVEDKSSFEKLLQALDVPAFAIKNPTITGKLNLTKSLALDDFLFAKTCTKRPIKMALPGPYLISRSAWVEKLSGPFYPTREKLNEEIVGILRGELLRLAEAGAAFVQFDEPVLTELAFAGKSATRTFMCAALAAQASPEEELELAVELINRVVDGIQGPIIGLHICRGNWSAKDDVLLRGPYDGLIPYLNRMKVDQFVLEYATPRAGDFDCLKHLEAKFQLGYGCVNPRTTDIEAPEDIAAKVRKVELVMGKGRIFLNPDCGFSTFAERPVNNAEIAKQKLQTLVSAAELLRK